jgi:hypothetical protein
MKQLVSSNIRSHKVLSTGEKLLKFSQDCLQVERKKERRKKGEEKERRERGREKRRRKPQADKRPHHKGHGRPRHQ